MRNAVPLSLAATPATTTANKDDKDTVTLTNASHSHSHTQPQCERTHEYGYCCLVFCCLLLVGAFGAGWFVGVAGGNTFLAAKQTRFGLCFIVVACVAAAAFDAVVAAAVLGAA